MAKNATAEAEACDENRPTAAFDKIEFRSGELIVGCQCTKNDGMQHDCRRTKCMGRPPCVAYPAAECLPSRPCPPPRRRRLREDDRDAQLPRAAARLDKSAPDPVKRAASCRPANRVMLQWAIDQYDDRPAVKKLFEPCRVHRVMGQPDTDQEKSLRMPDDEEAIKRCTRAYQMTRRAH